MEYGAIPRRDARDHEADPGRREALRYLAGLGALGVASPLLSVPVAAPARANPGIGVIASENDLVFIPLEKAKVYPSAEWDGKGNTAADITSPLRYAITEKNVAKAPPEAAFYDAYSYEFMPGAIRVLKYKMGAPAIHMITYETVVYVLKGSFMLHPVYGFKNEPEPVNEGDVLFNRAGVLRNPNPAGETILLTMVVGNHKNNPVGSILSQKSAPDLPTAQWQVDGKAFTATTPAELKNAPANAARFMSRRYEGDGNSVRVASFKKGGRTNAAKPARSDVLIYLVSGGMRRTEGNQTFEMKAGDATREVMGNLGYWDVLEDSTFVAVDAPFNPDTFYPWMVAG